MFQDITVEELLEMQVSKPLQLIDVRSPREFIDATIPGSVNIPLFNNEERGEVGTLYTQVGHKAAKDKGLEIFSKKLPAFINECGQFTEDKVVFCWRGGMRSKAAATVLSLMGIHVYRLAGGIRSYREWVLSTLQGFELQPHCIVINGNTGTGKTEILRQLAVHGYPVIDLENLAQHRGSIFGHIGLEPRNQKSFDTLLLAELIRWNDHPYIIIEAESRRVGKVVIPDFLIEAMESGQWIFLDMPRSTRARHIVTEYQPDNYKNQVIEAFEYIRKRIHTPVSAEITQYLQENRFEEAVELMLKHYYDPRYEHAASQYTKGPTVFQVDDIDQAGEAIKQYIGRIFSS